MTPDGTPVGAAAGPSDGRADLRPATTVVTPDSGWHGTPEDDPTRVYLTLIRMARPTRELLLCEGIPATRLDPALHTLALWGLVKLSPDGEVDVPPPAEAMVRHAGRSERRASAARASADALARVYNAARTSALGDGELDGEVLRDLEAVSRATNEAIAQAEGAVRMFRGMTVRTRLLIDAPLASHREPSVGAGGRLLEMLTIWDSAVLELPYVLPVMAARREGRETQRFLPLVPISVIVVDDQACIVEWTGDGDGTGPQGLFGTSAGAVGAGRALFERFWQLATPVTVTDEPQGLDERDATVLRLMAAGVADASIARQTGISQRTVERRVRYVMERLGAQTRFQAGVQASRQGWI